MKLIRDDVNKIIAPFKRRKGFLYGRLVLEWEEVVGKEIASICAPYKMTFYKGKPGTLVLQTKSATALYLSSLEEDIIKMIHQYFEQTPLSHSERSLANRNNVENIVSSEVEWVQNNVGMDPSAKLGMTKGKIQLVDKIQYKHVLHIVKPHIEKAKVIPIEKVQEVQNIVDEIEDSAIRNALKKLGLSIVNSNV